MKKNLLFFVFALVISFAGLHAQCGDCSNIGQITQNSETSFTANSADAYYWEICSGTATINGANDGQSVSITCGGPSVLRVVRFDDGECIESCIDVCPEEECECPAFIPQSCMQISVVEECLDYQFTISNSCLPDAECIDFVTWRIGLGIWNQSFTNNSTSILFTIPSGNWPNHWLVATAVITLTNGEECEYGNRLLIDCPSGHGGGNGKSNRIEKPGSHIFPNPIEAGQSLIIPHNELNQAQKIELRDANGRLITSFLPNSTLQLPESLTSGVYFIHIHEQEKATVHKLILR